MINFKKKDERDFMFLNKPLSDEEEKALGDFLKSHKTKAARTPGIRKQEWLPKQ